MPFITSYSVISNESKLYIYTIYIGKNVVKCNSLFLNNTYGIFVFEKMFLNLTLATYFIGNPKII